MVAVIAQEVARRVTQAFDRFRVGYAPWRWVGDHEPQEVGIKALSLVITGDAQTDMPQAPNLKGPVEQDATNVVFSRRCRGHQTTPVLSGSSLTEIDSHYFAAERRSTVPR